MEGAKAVVKAAIALKVPIILQVHPSSLKFGGLPFLDMLVSFRSKAKRDNVSVFINLDHITSDEDIRMICEWGKADSIMIDGSDKPFEENVQWTKRMVRICNVFLLSLVDTHCAL